MAKSNFGRGNITARSAASTAVKREKRAIDSRAAGVSVGEARRAHRKSNARSLGRTSRRG